MGEKLVERLKNTQPFASLMEKGGLKGFYKKQI
jgi:hypothetical protein